MGGGNERFDWWRLPTSILWLVFFAAGLAPDVVYEVLRECGGVVTQRAMVNSPHAVMIALAMFIGVFTYQKCRDAGLSDTSSWGNGLQLFIVALFAFLPFPFILFLRGDQILVPNYRWLLYAIGSAKLAAWLYLLGLMLRYCLSGDLGVFGRMVALFPSARYDAMVAENAQPEESPSTDPAETDDTPV
ncbi:MAG: hypothetical protein QG656_484 [Candidatus Hydrogenedentes bacterium]|nr:hypothetical protein [Candidatus Hydrogenedentota bacterium]